MFDRLRGTMLVLSLVLSVTALGLAIHPLATPAHVPVGLSSADARALTTALTPADSIARAPAEHVSLVQLVVTPERYQDRRVVVAGYLRTGVLHAAIYFHQEDALRGIFENAIPIELADPAEAGDYTGYQHVSGRFELSHPVGAGLHAPITPTGRLRDVVVLGAPHADGGQPITP